MSNKERNCCITLNKIIYFEKKTSLHIVSNINCKLCLEQKLCILECAENNK